MDTSKEESVWQSRRALMLVVALLTLLGLAGMGTTAIVIIQQRTYVACQRAYNDDVTQVISERAAAGELDRQAIQVISSSTVAMVEILLMPGSTQEQRLSAIQTWRDAQSRANRMIADASNQRRENPLPIPRQC